MVGCPLNPVVGAIGAVVEADLQSTAEDANGGIDTGIVLRCPDFPDRRMVPDVPDRESNFSTGTREDEAFLTPVAVVDHQRDRRGCGHSVEAKRMAP